MYVGINPLLNYFMFRGDMVEVLKGPDKGKLGIIKMIVQVGKLRPICSLLSCSHAKT